MASPIKGRATILTAAVLLLASAFYDRLCRTRALLVGICMVHPCAATVFSPDRLKNHGLTDHFPIRESAELEAYRLERIMYGLDFPNIPYAWDRELKWLSESGLSHDDFEG